MALDNVYPSRAEFTTNTGQLPYHIKRMGEDKSPVRALLMRWKESMNNNKPTRIADVIGGHIHPAICVTQSGALLAVYNKEGGGGKELLLSRSNDGGM